MYSFGGLDGKESVCSAEDLGLNLGLERFPREGKGYPLQHSDLENLHGQKKLAGYSPWGHKESDMTERLNTHTLNNCRKEERYISRRKW